MQVAEEGFALSAWLAPYDRNLSSGFESSSVLLRQCSSMSLSGLMNAPAGPCAVNANKSLFLSVPQSGSAMSQGAARDGVLARLRGASLEVSVPLCAAAGRGRQCSMRPVTNFHSPIAVLPVLVEVAVTPSTRQVGRGGTFKGGSFDGLGGEFFAPHPAFEFKAFDLDRDSMVQFNPMRQIILDNWEVERSWDGKGQIVDAECFLQHSPDDAGDTIWSEGLCVGGNQDSDACVDVVGGTGCAGNGRCSRVGSRCRRFSDLDANPFRRRGNQVKLDFGNRVVRACDVVSVSAMAMTIALTHVCTSVFREAVAIWKFDDTWTVQPAPSCNRQHGS